MSYESRLIKALWDNVDKVLTKHITLVDSRFYSLDEVPEVSVPSDKNLLWSEPFDGLYLIDVNIARYFRDTCNSVEELFKEAVLTGYRVESKSFKVPLKVKDIKKIKSIFPRIAILTLFSSKAKTRIYEKVVDSLDLPYGVVVDLVLGDNSGIEISKNIVEEFRNTAKYARINIIPLGAPYNSAPGEDYLKPEKHAHVAVLYSKALSGIVDSYDYILKIEDDVEPPADGFVRLYEQMKRREELGEKVACVAGYYKQKICPSIPCFSLNKEIWGGAPRIENVPKELFKVEMQGGGFALYSAKAIKEVLPYRLTYKTIKNSYYMTGWDGTIGEVWANSGWLQYCDGTLYCEHFI
jgi:hypothetical protein